MKDVSPLSPEERRKRLIRERARAHFQARLEKVRPGSRTYEVVKRVLVGAYNDGFIHAGNLAFLSILTLFPFFIIVAALARLFGQTEEGRQTVAVFLASVPPSVAEALAQPIDDVLAARSGSLLWLGALVGLWTTASFIETIREILRRAYGTHYGRPFYHYRLVSTGIIIASVLLALTAFGAQVLLTGIEQFVVGALPTTTSAQIVDLFKLIPAGSMFVAFYLLFYTLTPSRYRVSSCPKWPGALLVTLWWLVTTDLLPVALRSLGSYDLTYGSLAGVIIAMVFFFVIGFGVVLGAELNAALAETPETSLKGPGETLVEFEEGS